MAASRAFRLWASVFAIAALPPLLAVWTDRPATPLPADAPATEFSEARALPIVEELAGKIGHRLAGSEGARRGETYLIERLREIPGLEVEVQDVDGTTGAVRYRVCNVVARLPGEEPTAVLVSAHYDSALGSVGAADDAVGVAAAVEVARALAAGPKLRHSVVFNLNEGEELGLYGARGFLQHPWAADVRAFVNLEAAGAGGRPMLFQAGLPSLASAYGRGAPHPHGSVFAQDVFESGIIPSDTDYRIYRKEGRLPGLDLALYQDGWAYHTRLDRVERVEPGSLQEMGANALGVVRELAGGDLTRAEEPRSPIFYDLLGLVMVRYSAGTASALALLALVVMAFAVFAVVRRGRLSARSILIGCALNAIVLVVAVLLPLAIAFLVTGILDQPFGWYARPWLAVVAFGAPAIGVILATHGVIAAPSEHGALGDSARAMLLASQPLVWCFVLFVTTIYGLGSAYVALWWALPGALALRACATHQHRPLLVLAIGYVPGALVTSQLAIALVTNFVPMAGRMVMPFPMDYVIAAIVAVPTALCALAAVPTLHHVPSRLWRIGAAAFLAVGIGATIYLAVAPPHTAERPQRVRLEFAHGNGLETPDDNRYLSLRSLDRLPMDADALSGPTLGDDAAHYMVETDIPAPPPPDLEVVRREEDPDGADRLTLRLSPRGAHHVNVRLVLGYTYGPNPGPTSMSFVAPPAEGVEFTLFVPLRGPANGPPQDAPVVAVVSATYATLPAEVEELVRSLPEHLAVTGRTKVATRVRLSR